MWHTERGAAAALLVVAWIATVGGAQSGQTIPPSNKSAAVEHEPAIELRSNRLTVNVTGRPLAWVLDQISRQARVALIADPDVGAQPMTIDLRALPTDEALRRLLSDYDTFFSYAATTAGPARLTGVWVYAKGHGRQLAPIPPELWASTKDIEARLAQSDPDDRIAALDALVERGGNAAQGAILQALMDSEPRVRSRALYAATAGGVDLPVESLLRALGDGAVDVRFLALQALANRPEAQMAAEWARNDSNPAIRQLAEQVLKNASTTSRRRVARPRTAGSDR